jgi:membrane protein implicated in regulation of membrane protease activity
MLTVNFWAWVIIAVLLGIGEMVTGGLFMLPFALGAAVAAAITLTGAALVWQLLGFAATTGAAYVLIRFYLVRHNASPSQPLAGNRMIGKTGVVLKALDPVADTGIVRVDREQWRAEPDEHVAVPEGTRVTVIAVEGAHLVVRPTSPEPMQSQG